MNAVETAYSFFCSFFHFIVKKQLIFLFEFDDNPKCRNLTKTPFFLSIGAQLYIFFFFFWSEGVWYYSSGVFRQMQSTLPSCLYLVIDVINEFERIRILCESVQDLDDAQIAFTIT